MSTIRRGRFPSCLGNDDFNEKLTNDLIVLIFKHLPKKDLVSCTRVCKRWHQVAQSDILWIHLDLSQKTLHKDTLILILSRGVEILRLAQTKIIPSTIPKHLEDLNNNYTCKLKYLDATMGMISSEILAELLFKCRYLIKLSLESCTLNEACCEGISHCIDLSILDLAMCEGINFKGILTLLKLRNLTKLNIAWCSLDEQSVSLVCNLLPPCLTDLNISGCGESINDSNIEDLVNSCPDLVELDISDNYLLTKKTIDSIVKLDKLVHLSISRCHEIPMEACRRLAFMPCLKYLDLFGLTVKELPELLHINKFMFSYVARPTAPHSSKYIWDFRIKD